MSINRTMDLLKFLLEGWVHFNISFYIIIRFLYKGLLFYQNQSVNSNNSPFLFTFQNNILMYFRFQLNMDPKLVAENLEALLKDLQSARPKRDGLFITRYVQS